MTAKFSECWPVGRIRELSDETLDKPDLSRARWQGKAAMEIANTILPTGADVQLEGFSIG
jgi:hypothetical protein